MKAYIKQERLKYAKRCSISIRIVYKEYIFRIFTLIAIPHKKFNRVKYLLRNYKKLKFTLDIYSYVNFNDFNNILEDENIIKYIFNVCYKRIQNTEEEELIEEWKQKNTMNM